MTSAPGKPSIIPRWLLYSLLTAVLWGAWGFTTKIVSEDLDTNANQVFYSLGLLPLLLFVSRSPKLRTAEPQRRVGNTWAFVTGVLAVVGNLAFFEAFVKGGRISVVAPFTSLYPIISVVAAVILLRERPSKRQSIGFAVGFVALYLLVR